VTIIDAVKPPPHSFSDEVWHWLCSTDLVRPAVVAAGRARLAANDWPPAIAVADAVIAGWSTPQLALR
jgi:hypothetical protein